MDNFQFISVKPVLCRTVTQMGFNGISAIKLMLMIMIYQIMSN